MDDSANPPAWAQTLLAIVVDPDRHDAIAGDLIEAFRDDKVPSLGLSRACRWYAYQAAGYVWRSSWRWIALLAAVFIGEDLLNSFRRPDGSILISGFSSMSPTFLLATFAVLLICGYFAGRRSNSIVAGLITCGFIQAAVLAVMALWWNATFYPFAQAMKHNPYWIGAWHYSGGGESFERWAFFDNIGALIMATLVLMPASALVGGAGAALGKLLRTGRPEPLVPRP